MSQSNPDTDKPREIARWMLEYLKREKYMYQTVVVWKINEEFGDQYTYDNERGNLAIDRKVLSEFKKLTRDTVVWERGSRLWRMREDYDPSGKRQAD